MAFRKALALTWVLFCAPSAVWAAGQVAAEARAVPSKATIGDEIRLLVRVERPRAYSVEPPSDKLALAPFELKRVEIAPAETGKNRVTQTFTLVLTVFETGKMTVPAFDVKYLDASGGAGRVSAGPVPVEIVSVAGNLTGKEDIKPIKGPLSLSLAALYALALGALAAVLAGIFAFLVVRRLRTRAVVDPESLLPPHERAERELARLQSKGLLDAGQVKEYYGELGDILRRYLERRYGFAVLELTTAETVKLLKDKGFASSVLEKTREVLDTADLAKFAKFVPPRVAGERARAALLEIVDATKPKEAEKEAKR